MIGLEFVKRATSGDLNNDTTTGYYFINTWSGHINGPASVNGIGALLVFNIQMSSTCVCQLLILNTGMYSRRYWDGSWSEWKL